MMKQFADIVTSLEFHVNADPRAAVPHGTSRGLRGFGQHCSASTSSERVFGGAHGRDFLGLQFCTVRASNLFRTGVRLAPPRLRGSDGEGEGRFFMVKAMNDASNEKGRARLSTFGLDGYNAALISESHCTVGVNCGISTGRGGVVKIPDFLGRGLFKIDLHPTKGE